MKSIIAAAALFSAQTSEAQSTTENYREGVEARLAGEPETAVRRLQQVIAVQPENADAHLQLGLALLALNRLDDAGQAFRRTLEISPDYADARIGLARIWQRRGDREAALLELEQIDGPNPEAEALADQLGSVSGNLTARWRLDFDSAYSALEGAQDWQESRIAVGYRVSDTAAVGAALEAARRFGRSDVYGEARFDLGIGKAVNGYILLGGTPDADFRPRWQIGGGVSVRLRDGPAATVLRLDARQADYPAGDIQTLTPGLEQYVAGGRGWLTAQWINVFEDRTGRHEMGWLARGDLMVADELRLFAGMADAPDVSEGVVVETFSLFGGMSWDVDARHTLRASVAHEDRATGADRLSLSIGVGVRF